MLIQDPVVDVVQPFVTANISSHNKIEDIRSAILVIGAVVDGPKRDQIMHLIRNTISHIFS